MISLQEKYPHIAQQWHPTKNGSLTPSDVYPSANKKVWWVCSSCDCEWESTINNRAKGKGCPYCAGKRPSPKNNLQAVYPEIAVQWHPTKNVHAASEALPHSHKKFWWKCESNHEWEAVLSNRTTNRAGCPYCSKHSSKSAEIETLADRCPELLKEWHERNVLKPDQLAPRAHAKVWWRCTKGHEWEALVANRAKGVGCPYCKGNKVTPENSLAVMNPRVAAEWHPTKNEELKPEGVNKSAKYCAWWLCPGCLYEWQATVNNRHDKDSGCPRCTHMVSKPELRLWSELSVLLGEDKVLHRHTGFGFELDVYIAPFRTGIEYDGIYWHKDKVQSDNTKYKRAKELGITFIRISEVEGALADYVLRENEVTPNLIKRVIDILAGCSGAKVPSYAGDKFIGDAVFDRIMCGKLSKPSAGRAA